MVIGRDIIVPIVNARNPMLNLLYQQGISPLKFALLFNDSSKRNWGAIVPNGQNVPVQIYVQDNGKILSLLKDFSKATVNSSNANLVDRPENVIAGVEKDINAIGFCSLNDLKVYQRAAANENIRLLPIDKNGNGRMDNFENIYRNPDEFTRGVWVGKYPGTLTKNIYAVSTAKPTNENELEFLMWILAEGQAGLNSNGFCELASNEIQSNLAALLPVRTKDFQAVQTASAPKSWHVFITLFILVCLFVSVYIYSRRRVRDLLPGNEIHVAPFLIENAMDAPKGLYFDKTHTWAFMEQDGNVRIGVDDFLQHITGKLTKIRMKEAGEMVRKGEIIMTIIREGKQLNIYAPISGTILSQNIALLDDSGIVNSSPFFKGWVYQIEPKNWLRETQFMLMGEKYTEWLRDEFVRLKDFVAASVRTDQMAYAHVILQDGGELTDNVLADLGPEIWEEFQTRFIDTSR
jgi:glycine cleavage system H lipoate-binding protein